MAVMSPDEILRRQNQNKTQQAEQKPVVPAATIPESPVVSNEVVDIPSESDVIDSIDSIETELTETKRIPDTKAVQKRTPAKPRAKPKTSNAKSGKKEQVRDLPSEVMNAIRQEFPQALSKADAISAYVFVHSAGTEQGAAIQLSDMAREAVKHYEGDNLVMLLDKRIAHLEKLVAKQSEVMQTVELALAYVTCDRTFGTKTTQTSPKQAEFRETAVLDVLDRLRQQAAEQRAVDNVKNGRPIK